MSGAEAGALAQTVVVQLVPDAPDFALSLEAPEGGATVRWLKEELCRQDPTGEATPDDFRLSSASKPGRALGDEVFITAELIPLTVMSQEEAAEADSRAREEDERKAREEAEEKAREDAARRAREEEAERQAQEQAAEKARAYFAERKAKEEAEEKAREAERKAREEAQERARQEEEANRKAKEEADRIAREEEERRAHEAAERRAKEEAEQKAREEAERKAEEERKARAAAELAEQKAKAEAEEKANAEAKRKSVVDKAREAAKEGVEAGVAKIQVAFKYKGQSWNKSFEVDRGCIVLDLKRKMMEKAPEEAAWFELQRGGRRIGDLEAIREDGNFVFCFLGPQQGPRLAARDLERKASEQAMLEAQAAERAAASQDVVVDVRLKKGVWEEKRISVTVKGGASAREVREAVAKSCGEDVARIALFEDGDAPEPMEDHERIGLRREFRARCAAPEGHQATAAELWQAADDLKWFAWHEIWVAAYTGYAAKRQGPEKSDMLEKAQEDTTMSSKHYQAIEESKAFPSRLLRRLRQQADADGRAAADAALEWRELDPSKIKVFDPPGETDEDLWSAMVETLHVAAVEVVGMLSGGSRPPKISNTNFHPAWQKVVGRLCGPVAGAATNAELPAKLPLVLGTELKWLIWNDTWRAANQEYAQGSSGPKHAEKAAKSKEDAARAEGHFEAVKAMGGFSEDTLQRIKQRVQAAGQAAGWAALAERPIKAEEVQETPAPAAEEFNPVLWGKIADVILECASAVARMSVEGVFHFICGKMHMVDFEVLIRGICDPPFDGAPRESNASAAPARTRQELEDAKKAFPLEAAVAKYENELVAGPLRVLDPQEVKVLNEEFNSFLKRDIHGQWQRLYNAHVLSSCVYKLASHPKLVAAAASVLKSDTVLLHSSMLVPCETNKAGLDEGAAHWHAEGQPMMDSLGSLEHYVTIMVALTPCARASGCAEFVMGPGLPTKKMELQPGECSLSHPSVYYKMMRNGARERRDMIHLRYISGTVRDTYAELHEAEPRDLVALLAGKDMEGHFRLLRPPGNTMGHQEVQTWERLKQSRERRFKQLM